MMMMKRKKIEDALPVENGILTTIGSKFELDFADVHTLSLMDVEYVEGYSAIKTVSRIVEKNTVDNVVNVDKLSNIIGNRYVNKWNMMWNGLTVEYDILENFNMTEEEKTDRDIDDTLTLTENETAQHTLNDTESKTEETEASSSISNTQTDNTTITEAGTEARLITDDTSETDNASNSDSVNETMNETTGLYGFNSGAASNADKTDRTTQSSISGSNQRELERSSTVDDNLTKNNTNTKEGSVVDNGQTSKEESKTIAGTLARTENSENEKTGNTNKKTIDNIVRTLTRKGNIGTTSSAQLQEQYLKITATWYDFCKIVYDDLDSILTLYII